jgi:hypothetical protein
MSNRTDKPITLLVDSNFFITSGIAFKDSLNGVRIVKKKLIDFGKGKWADADKSNLENLLRHTTIMTDDSVERPTMPVGTNVQHIRLMVEELWVKIKAK